MYHKIIVLSLVSILFTNFNIIAYADNATPLKQVKAGVKTSEIICAKNLQLIIKSNNNQPTCVKPDSIRELVGRGWGHADNWIKITNVNDAINYQITNGRILAVAGFSSHTNIDSPGETLVTILNVKVEANSNGNLTVILPRDLIDSKNYAQDGDFVILVNNLDATFEEAKHVDDRTLEISFEQGTNEVSIYGYGFVNEKLPIPPN